VHGIHAIMGRIACMPCLNTTVAAALSKQQPLKELRRKGARCWFAQFRRRRLWASG
jgi:hypothetical protein